MKPNSSRTEYIRPREGASKMARQTKGILPRLMARVQLLGSAGRRKDLTPASSEQDEKGAAETQLELTPPLSVLQQ